MNIHIRHIVIAVGVALAAATASAGAQVYKWVDDKGQTHYGQQPPLAPVVAPKKLDIALSGNDPPRATNGCYSIQCQYERLRDDRMLRDAEWRKDEESRATIAVQRRAAEEPPRSVTDPRWSGIYPGSPVFIGRPIYRPHLPVVQPVGQPSAAEPAVRIRMSVGR